LYNIDDIMYSALSLNAPVEVIKSILYHRRKEFLAKPGYLLEAIVKSSAETVKFLVKSGFKLENQNIDPILHICSVSNPNEETLNILKYLLTLTFEVNKVDRYNRTPLILLSMKDQNEYVREMIKLLLNYGAKVNESDEDSHNALYYLEKKSNSGASESKNLLIKYGAK
jgi:ankyrin repeat protein